MTCARSLCGVLCSSCCCPPALDGKDGDSGGDGNDGGSCSARGGGDGDSCNNNGGFPDVGNVDAAG